MVSLRSAFLSLAVASAGVLAQGLTNPITRPSVGDTLVAGSSFNITWTVTTPDELVSLILCKGPGNNIAHIGTIADSIPDDGFFDWEIPSYLPPGNDYAIEIIVGPASNASSVTSADYNFTPLLPLVNNGTNIGSATLYGSTTPTGNSSAPTSAPSFSNSTTASTAPTTFAATTAEPFVTKSTGGPFATSTPGSSSSSSATRIATSFANVPALLALIIAVAVGVVASF